MMQQKIRVLIVDDHMVVRNGIRLLLETDERISVVGEAANGLEALEQVESLDSDLVLMDLRMPEMDGMTAIHRLRDSHPETAVIILTTYNEDELMLQGLSAGAKGYLLKDMSREALLNTVFAACRGDTLLSADILTRVLRAGEPPRECPFTEREREVLRAIAAGHTSRSAGDELGITERTVKAHLTNVFDKLGVDTRAAAIATAVESGWL